MMKSSCLLFLLWMAPLQAEVLVIGSPACGVNSLTTEQVEDIFMGRSRSFPNGKPAQALDQSGAVRRDFYQRLLDRSIEQIDAYWARIVFTGKESPPKQLPDNQTVLNEVKRNESAIGYVLLDQAPRDVHVFLILP
jgi:ABC-type phosphate transport system substrate-binding protein